MRVPRPLALACSDSGDVVDIMAIRENFIRKIHKCQPFVKIFSREINSLYGSLQSENITFGNEASAQAKS